MKGSKEKVKNRRKEGGAHAWKDIGWVIEGETIIFIVLLVFMCVIFGRAFT